jgi:hypothetical protein
MGPVNAGNISCCFMTSMCYLSCKHAPNAYDLARSKLLSTNATVSAYVYTLHESTRSFMLSQLQPCQSFA